jgi:hypothetical protein
MTEQPVPHYNCQAIEPIEYMGLTFTPDEFKGYLKGNIIKYISRANQKNGIDDYKKARVYIDWLIEYTETGKVTRLSEKR